jgi:hypothetical protein
MDVNGAQMAAQAGAMVKALQVQGLGGQLIGKTLAAMDEMRSSPALQGGKNQQTNAIKPPNLGNTIDKMV